jgi:hypothetical protein
MLSFSEIYYNYILEEWWKGYIPFPAILSDILWVLEDCDISTVDE